MKNSLNQIKNDIINNKVNWTDFLAFVGKMYAYKFNEIADIYVANPNATLVATIKQWNAQGQRIKKGEKGIAINQSNGIKKYVFDISQIQSNDIEYHTWQYNPNATENVYIALETINKNININRNSSVVENIYDFFNSVISNEQIADDVKNFIADSCTYAVLSRIHSDISDIRFDFSNIEKHSNYNWYESNFDTICSYLNAYTNQTLRLIRKVCLDYENTEHIEVKRTAENENVSRDTSEEVVVENTEEVVEETIDEDVVFETTESAESIATEENEQMSLFDETDEADTNSFIEEVSELVREKNIEAVENIVVGSHITLGNIEYEVTKIDGDFMMSIERADKTEETFGSVAKSFIGDWKSQLLDEVGNSPLIVLSPSVVEELNKNNEIVENAQTDDVGLNDVIVNVPNIKDDITTVNVRDIIAERNYKKFAELYPAFLNHDYSYMRYEGGEGWLPLSMQWLGDNTFSLMHIYWQGGDMFRDPDIVFEVDNNAKTIKPISFENSGLSIYEEYTAGDYQSKKCNEFVSTWLKNLSVQPYALNVATRTVDEESVEFDTSREEKRYDVIYRNSGNQISAYNLLERDENNNYVLLATYTLTSDYVSFVDNDLPELYKKQILTSARSNGAYLNKEFVAYLLAEQIITDISNKEDIQNKYNLAIVNEQFSSYYDNIPLVAYILEKYENGNATTVFDYDIEEALELIDNAIKEYNHSVIDEKCENVLSEVINNIDTLDTLVESAYNLKDGISSRVSTTEELAEEEITVSETENDNSVSIEDIFDKSITDDLVRYGSGFENGKLRISKYYHDNNPTNKEFAEFLSKEFGIGGHSGRGFVTWSSHNSNGITLTLKYNDEEFRHTYSWTEISKRIGQLIDDGKYIEDDVSRDTSNKEENADNFDDIVPKFKVNDIITINNRERTVTKIYNNKHDDNALYCELRDDNTGWYPLFQSLPVEYVNSQIDMNVSHDTLVEEIESTKQIERRNFVITNDDLGIGSVREKMRANLDALKTLAEIEFDNRLATPEEQEILSNYVGWGGLQEIFDETNTSYQDEYKELITLTSPEEYESAKMSTLNAHYTQPIIIKAMYKALENFGFNGGKILEPAMAVGNFFGSAPQNIVENSRLYGVELDSVSGRIAKQLYQKADISVCGFEDTNFADNSFDVAIGNVPFGNYSVFDRRYNSHKFVIHDYFFAKSLDKVKPNGVVAFITSKGTLDKLNSKFREYICERAELIGAIRLPNTAFKSNAGTEVVSDIIFLKKRPHITAIRDNWVDTDYDYNVNKHINSYFIEHPEMICGNLTTRSTRYGYDIDVTPFEDISFEEALNNCISKLQATIDTTIDDVVDITDSADDSVIEADYNVRNFAYCERDGEIWQRTNDIMIPVTNIPKKYLNVVKDYIALANATRQAVEVQNETDDDQLFEVARIELNEAYDNFAKHGFALKDEQFKKLVQDDSNYPLLSTLEGTKTSSDGKTTTYKEAKIFTERTVIKHKSVTHCDTSEDSLIVSMNSKGRVDLEYMAKLTDKSVETIIDELNGTYIFRNPTSIIGNDKLSGWETADEYLSGDIRVKLNLIKTIVSNNPQYEVNLKALESAMPERVSASDIKISLGASWIPEDIIESFIIENFGFPPYYSNGYFNVEHSISTGSWHINNKNSGNFYTSTNTELGTADLNALYILEKALNLQDATVYDRVTDNEGKTKSVKNAEKTAKACAKQDIIKQKFEDWIYTDAERTQRLEDIYNVKFNSERLREFDGSHLEFEGMSKEIELRPHQKNAVARIIYGGNTLLAHCVGAGKTYTMATACMKLKQTGMSNKSLFVVPNHLIGQWSAEFTKLYPNANLLPATTEDFKKNKRKQFLSRIATGNYDAIIMGYSTFSEISVSDERREKYYHEEIEALEEAMERSSSRDFTTKQMAAKKKELENRLKKMEYVKDREDIITFEELGVDQLFIDEAHNFKNLGVNTKLGRVAGISTTQSKRSEDLLMKIRYLKEINGGERGVVFATGTPISNSVVEMYTMQRYLQPDYLEQHDMHHFDNWIGTFGNVTTEIELSPTGTGFRANKRCGSYKNLPELMRSFKRIADVQTSDMLKLPVPRLKNDKYTLCITTPSDEQKQFIQECGERADEIRNNKVDPSVDNMLKITNDGKMCALDMRLVDPDAEDDPNSKINVAVENIFNKYQEFSKERYTQVVFLDKSTPKKDEFNLYDDMKNKLISMGVAENEIKFIHEAKNDQQKLKMFEEVNKGNIRIIFGSTEKMGAGTNIQERLCAEHHIDVPWRPSDIEQREGRILRQGNNCEEVEIFRYATENTFDSYSWQTIETKQKYISQVMTDKPQGREIDDIDSATLNYAEIKMLATGDPRIKEHLELTLDVQKLKMLRGEHLKAQIECRKNLTTQYPQDIEKYQRFKDMFARETEYAKQQKPFDDCNPFKIIIGGKVYTDKEEAAKEIAYATSYLGATEVEIGEYRGFKLLAEFSHAKNLIELKLRHEATITCQKGTGVGTFTRLDNLIADKFNELYEKHTALLDDTKQNIIKAQAIVDTPFARETEYQDKRKRLNELTLALGIGKSDNEGRIIDDTEDKSISR